MQIYIQGEDKGKGEGENEGEGEGEDEGEGDDENEWGDKGRMRMVMRMRMRVSMKVKLRVRMTAKKRVRMTLSFSTNRILTLHPSHWPRLLTLSCTLPSFSMPSPFLTQVPLLLVPSFAGLAHEAQSHHQVAEYLVYAAALVLPLPFMLLVNVQRGLENPFAGYEEFMPDGIQLDGLQMVWPRRKLIDARN